MSNDIGGAMDRALRPLVIIIGVVLALTACTAGGTSSEPSPTGTATGRVDPDPSASTEPPAASPMNGDGSRGEVLPTTAGEVTVTAKPAHVAVDSVITAEVGNGMAEDIYVVDLRTNCSIAVLERRVSGADDSWERYEDCGSERLARTLAIGPGLGRIVRIDPDALSAEGQPVPPGIYRLSVTWSTTKDGADNTVTASAPFDVE
jgi:hypothetical protein